MSNGHGVIRGSWKSMASHRHSIPIRRNSGDVFLRSLRSFAAGLNPCSFVLQPQFLKSVVQFLEMEVGQPPSFFQFAVLEMLCHGGVRFRVSAPPLCPRAKHKSACRGHGRFYARPSLRAGGRVLPSAQSYWSAFSFVRISAIRVSKPQLLKPAVHFHHSRFG